MTSTQNKGRFASKTTFEALQVESGEDTDEEVEVVELPTPPPSSFDVPAKLSKTAAKKAAKAAREARQKQKAGEAVDRTPSPETLSSKSVSSRVVPTESLANGFHSSAEEYPAAVDLPTMPQREAPVPVLSKQEEAEALDVHPPVSLPEKESAPLTATEPTPADPSMSYHPEVPVQQHPLQPPPVSETPQEADKVKKRQNVLTRTLWTFIMIGGFIGLLLLGHAYMILLVMVCQTIVYREVTALFSLKSSAAVSEDKDLKGKDPWSKTLNWYFFAVTNYFLYGESIIYYFKHVIFSDSQLQPFATNHRIISFTLYIIAFVGFVMSLKKGFLKQQFGLFCWVHMSLLLIVVSSHFIVNNILEGLIWFWVPASLVICNDIFAYIWGVTVGRTPLIKLSPKKTVEGFVGAFFSTVLFGLLWGTYFMRFNYMICPVHNLGVSAWDAVQCTPNPIFVWKEWQIWKPLANILSTAIGRSITTVPYVPYQFHLCIMSCFASLVAPFGGFFASGFKRAFNIKDFGHSIPGHGGMTDRMDCQFLMGVFTYVYYSSLIRDHHVTVGSILQTIASGLTVDEQLEIIADLRRYLEGQGIQVPC